MTGKSILNVINVSAGIYVESNAILCHLIYRILHCRGYGVVHCNLSQNADQGTEPWLISQIFYSEI